MKVSSVLILALSAASSASAFVQKPSAFSLPRTATTTTFATSGDHDESANAMRKIGEAALAATLLLGVVLPNGGAAQAIEYRLPPIDRSDATRCTLKSSTIGQSNAQRDKLFDLRECKLEGANAQGYDLSGVLM